jgi:hypothetical protein
MMDFAIKLLIAHVLGDFVLQPDRWVEDKRDKGFKSVYFYLHGLVHLLSLLIILGFDLSYYLSIVAIVVSHLVIDYFKNKLEPIWNSRLLFGLDQFVHLLVLGGVVSYHFSYEIDLEIFSSTPLLLFMLAFLLVTFVSSVVVKTIMSTWDLKEDKSDESLDHAGKYIGVIERLFVFGFILLHQWSAIGFLIAAKSVFRFSDLSRAKDRKLTEYILIGTLLSFGLAVIIGLAYQYILQYV